MGLKPYSFLAALCVAAYGLESSALAAAGVDASETAPARLLAGADGGRHTQMVGTTTVCLPSDSPREILTQTAPQSWQRTRGAGNIKNEKNESLRLWTGGKIWQGGRLGRRS